MRTLVAARNLAVWHLFMVALAALAYCLAFQTTDFGPLMAGLGSAYDSITSAFSSASRSVTDFVGLTSSYQERLQAPFINAGQGLSK